MSGDGEDVKNLMNSDQSLDLILEDMKAGKSGSGSFIYQEEKAYISYAPVEVKNVFPVNSSDIARGVKNETTFVYSLALVEMESAMTQSFQTIDGITSKTVKISIGVISALIIVSTMLILWIATRVTRHMTEPILESLNALKDINR